MDRQELAKSGGAGARPLLGAMVTNEYKRGDACVFHCSRLAAGIALSLLFTDAAAAQIVDKKALTLAEARKIAEAAEAEAK